MQTLTEAAQARLVSRMVLTTDDGATDNSKRAETVPAVLLPLAQIVALVEKRLRWYGFRDWQVRDILCHRGPTVSVEVRGPAEAGMILTFHRDCGRLQAVARTPAPLSPEAAPLPAADAVADAAARLCVTAHIAHERRLTPHLRAEIPDDAARAPRLSGLTLARRQGRPVGRAASRI